MFAVLEYQWTWYRRNWRSSAVTTFVNPLLFLLAMGMGFGSQVAAGPATGGERYVVFLAPALVVTTAVQTAMFESSWAVFSQFKWQRTYFGMVATPVTPAQVLYGQLLWVALKLAFGCTAFLLVAGALGALRSPWAVVALPVGVLSGMAFSALLVAYTATVEKPDSFTGLFRFLVIPMTLFTGAFFPISQLPGWLHPLAWLTPVWHGIELARGAAFGTLHVLPALGHLAYLSALVAAGVLLGRRFFDRRLAV